MAKEEDYYPFLIPVTILKKDAQPTPLYLIIFFRQTCQTTIIDTYFKLTISARAGGSPSGLHVPQGVPFKNLGSALQVINSTSFCYRLSIY